MPSPGSYSLVEHNLSSMNDYLIFCLGFVCGFVPMATLIVSYYFRARKRVASIKEAILKHNQATRDIKAATDKIYGSTQRHD